jgi:linoleoyl-CoA desaturase
MSIQHDANHGAYSNHPIINRALRLTLDIMGTNSLMWRHKHNVVHHSFTNIEGADDDLDFGALARLTVHQPRRPWHRFQHLYLWFLYGFLLPKWVFYDDFVVLAKRRTGPHRLPDLARSDLVHFVLGKLFFVAWAIVIPALFHPIWQVLVFHLIAAFALGVTLSCVFQLAHVVEDAEVHRPAAPGEMMPNDVASHQLETTVDFARSSPILTWYFGGLNYQIEHHLFPKVCHLHYPALSRIVEDVALQHGVRYRAHRTFRAALASHFRLLRRLGQLPAAVPVPLGIPIGG